MHGEPAHTEPLRWGLKEGPYGPWKSREKKRGPTDVRGADSEQTPSSEEMHSHSHFPTYGANKKGSETGGQRPLQAGYHRVKSLVFWIPTTLTQGSR